MSSFPIISPQIIIIEPLLLTLYSHSIISPLKTHPLVKPSFGDALDSSVKRTVFMFVIMHSHDHSKQKSFFLGVREGILIKLLIEATIPMVWLRVVYALFGSLATLKIIPLVAPGILSTFLNRFISRIENKFKPPRSDRGFLFSSHSDLFFQQLIYLFWLWLFYNKDFFAFCKVFSTSHIARGIIKLTAWTTSFLDERLDFEITW